MPNKDHYLQKAGSGHALETDQQLLDAIIRARTGLRYGSIEITVHEGKVTQIERKEKFRFQS